MTPMDPQGISVCNDLISRCGYIVAPASSKRGEICIYSLTCLFLIASDCHVDLIRLIYSTAKGIDIKYDAYNLLLFFQET